MDKAYLSKEKYEEIQKELGELKISGRKRIAERLKQAKDLGDLSENSDYQEARDDQFRLEKRINQLDELLRKSEIIRKSGKATIVGVGIKVKVEKKDEICEYTIVGSNEADPSQGFISNESPIGKSLLGKKVGDEVSYKTLKGEVKMKIVSIE